MRVMVLGVLVGLLGCSEASDGEALAGDVGDVLAEIEVDASEPSDTAELSPETTTDDSDDRDGDDSDASNTGDTTDEHDVADTEAPAPWRDALTPMDTVISFAPGCDLESCNPSCRTIGSTCTFGIGVHVPDDDGPVTVVLVYELFGPSFEPVEVAADGTFTIHASATQTAAENYFAISGRFDLGPTLTLDAYSFQIVNTNGFMAGWTSTSTMRAPTTVSL